MNTSAMAFPNRPAYEFTKTWVDALPETERTLVERFAAEGLILFDPQLSPAAVDAARVFTAQQLIDQAGQPIARRVHNAWTDCPGIREIATHGRVLDTLALLYGRRPIPFQTVNFARGSEQRTHADGIHFNTIPSGFVCGVWVALEDATLDAGPLHYYPGSHRLPDYRMLDCMSRSADMSSLPTMDDYSRSYEGFIEAVLASGNYPRQELRISKGQAVIWAANLCHGGSPITDPRRTRLSQVTHYFFDNCLYYTPRLSHSEIGRLWLRNVREVGTGEFIPHFLSGRCFRVDKAGAYCFDRKMRPVPLERPALGKRIRRHFARWRTQVLAQVTRG